MPKRAQSFGGHLSRSAQIQGALEFDRGLGKLPETMMELRASATCSAMFDAAPLRDDSKEQFPTSLDAMRRLGVDTSRFE